MARGTILVVSSAAVVLSLALTVLYLSHSDTTYPWTQKLPSRESISQSPDELYRKCLDPYKQPGILHIPPQSPSDTTWVPVDAGFVNLPDPAAAAYPADSDPRFKNSGPPASLLNRSPVNWMKLLVAEHAQLNTSSQTRSEPISSDLAGELSWIWGKRVLLIGDSISRQEAENFCAEFGVKHQQPGLRYTNLWCHLREFNFTIFQWHLPSMMTRKNASWWWPEEMKYVPFEERIPHIHMSLNEEFIGANGRSPDLILWHSGIWDEMAFHKLAVSRGSASDGLQKKARHLSWDEAAFFAARLKKFLAVLENVFGDGVPTMYLSLTTGKTIDNTDLLVIDLDRITRAICRHLNIEIFDWNRIIAGHSSMYKDTLHPKRGPLSWVWVNMMLSYLFRAVGGLEVEGKVVRYPRADTIFSAGTSSAWEECHIFNMRYQYY